MIDPKIYFVAKYKVEGVEDNATLEECYDYLKDKQFLGIDIETTRKFPDRIEKKKGEVFRGGLDPYLSKIVMLQIGNFERVFVIDVRDFSNEELSDITGLLDYNSNITFIGQNLKFEQKHLKHNYGINFKRVIDIMIQEMCLYNGLSRSFSLAGMAKEYLGVKSVTDFSLFDLEAKATMDDEFLLQNEYLLTPFEIADTEQIDKSTRMEFVTIGDKPFTSKQILYGADDIIYPLLIAERQMLGRQLVNGEVYKPTKLFKLENQMLLVNADMELNGMPFDPEVWKAIEKDKHKEYDERVEILNKYIEQFYPKFVEEPNLFDFHRRCKIEWGSSKQVIQLFRFLDICPQEFSKSTKRMDYTVGAVALQKIIPNDYKKAYLNQKWIGFETDSDGRFIEDHERLILAYLLMKRSEQAVTTFGLDWLRYVHPITGRIHSNFRQILNSGRMASSAPNIQNIPQGIYRDAFVLKSGSVIAADFSNQEMRTVACLAKEAVMIQVFTEGHPIYGDDLHMATADSMNKALNPNDENLPTTKDPEFTSEHKKMRDNAKVVNFGIIYGKEAKGFAEDFGMSLEESEDFIKTYFQAYPGLKSFMKKQADETFKNNYIQIDNILDRRWFSPMFDEMNGYFEEVRSYFPREYFSYNGMTKEEKAIVKEEVNAEYPEVKQLWRKYFGIKGMIQRKSTNFAVQGLSGTETKTALVMLRNHILNNKIKDLRIINSVHDEILVETDLPQEEAGKYAEVLTNCMVDGANLYLDPPIMKSTPEIGTKWLH